MEIVDLYDIDKQKTNETIIRRTKTPEHKYRLVSRVAIINNEGKMLIQKRQNTNGRKGWDNFWDFSAAGACSAGENSRLAIQRELKEEIGIDYDFSKSRPKFTMNFPEGFDDIYVIEINDLDLTSLNLQKEEVAEVRWATMQDIFEMIDNNKFIPWNKDMVRLVFSMLKQDSGIQIKNED